MTKTKIINFCRLIAPSNFPINYLYRLSNDELLDRVFPMLKDNFIKTYNEKHSTTPIKDIKFVLTSINEEDERNIKIVLGEDQEIRTISDIIDSTTVMGRCSPIVTYKDDLVWKVKGVR